MKTFGRLDGHIVDDFEVTAPCNLFIALGRIDKYKCCLTSAKVNLNMLLQDQLRQDAKDAGEHGIALTPLHIAALANVIGR